jgi:hypothetical protein
LKRASAIPEGGIFMELVSEIFKTCLAINQQPGRHCSVALFGETHGLEISVREGDKPRPRFEIRLHYGDGYNQDGLRMLRDALRQYAL